MVETDADRRPRGATRSAAESGGRGASQAAITAAMRQTIVKAILRLGRFGPGKRSSSSKSTASSPRFGAGSPSCCSVRRAESIAESISAGLATTDP